MLVAFLLMLGRNSFPLRRVALSLRGFTLNELVVWVASLSILGGGALPAVQKVPLATNRAEIRRSLTLLAEVMHEYRTMNGVYPTTRELGQSGLLSDIGLVLHSDMGERPTALNPGMTHGALTSAKPPAQARVPVALPNRHPPPCRSHPQWYWLPSRSVSLAGGVYEIGPLGRF